MKKSRGWVRVLALATFSLFFSQLLFAYGEAERSRKGRRATGFSSFSFQDRTNTSQGKTDQLNQIMETANASRRGGGGSEASGPVPPGGPPGGPPGPPSESFDYGLYPITGAAPPEDWEAPQVGTMTLSETGDTLNVDGTLVVLGAVITDSYIVENGVRINIFVPNGSGGFDVDGRANQIFSGIYGMSAGARATESAAGNFLSHVFQKYLHRVNMEIASHGGAAWVPPPSSNMGGGGGRPVVME